MRGSECAYWLRLGLLLVCRSLRLSGAWCVGVRWVRLRCFASLPSPDGFPGWGWCRLDGRTNSGSQLVWIHRWLSACEQCWMDFQTVHGP